MRVGFNPHKDKQQQASNYFHQIIIPVYIPNHEGYFKDSFAILKLCLESLFSSIHSKTFVTIVNNESGDFVKDYLNELLRTEKIHEVIHTENIGKLNAIIKGLVGNNIELITITDSDVFFLPNWQNETIKVFSAIPKAGVVGIVPQFKMYESHCGNVLFDNVLSSKLRFMPVKNKEALVRFYDSLDWDRNYNHDYLEYALGLKVNSDLKVLIGSGHFVATYKKDMFDSVITYLGYKLGGGGEQYLDMLPLEKDYWRLTTYDNYAYHMGNTLEDWMNTSIVYEKPIENLKANFPKRRELHKILYFIKNRVFIKFISIKWIVKLFLRYKKLPKTMIEKY